MMSDPETRQRRLDATPLGRIGTVDDIANGVLFLASRRILLYDRQRTGNRRRLHRPVTGVLNPSLPRPPA